MNGRHTHILNGTVITAHGERIATLPRHSITVEGNVITAVSPAAPATQPGDDVIDASRYLVIPGLINTHHHLYQSLTRCMSGGQNLGLFDWLRFLYTQWDRVDHRAVKAAASVSIAELLLGGCTTTSDHFYLFPPHTDVRIESVLEAAEELGIRIHCCRGSMSTGASQGGLPPDSICEDEGRILRDCERAVEMFHDADPLAMRRIDLAPCSPFNVSEGLLRDTAAFARDRGLLLHTHAAETLDEQEYCLSRFGRRPVEYLADLGWLGRDVYLAHCVRLDDADIELLARTGTSVAHCPCSNMRLGSGIPPVARMLERGVNVGIGVDGSSSNDGGHMIAEVRQALLLQRVGGGANAMTAETAFRLATVGGARCLGRADRLGRLEPGFAADIAMFRADDIALAGAVEHDPLGALMLCHVQRADRVLVNGRTVVRDGRLALADEGKLAGNLNQIVRAQFGVMS